MPHDYDPSRRERIGLWGSVQLVSASVGMSESA